MGPEARASLPPARVSAGDVVGVRCPDGARAYDRPGRYEEGFVSWHAEHGRVLFVVCVVNHWAEAEGLEAWDEALVLGGDMQLGWLWVGELCDL